MAKTPGNKRTTVTILTLIVFAFGCGTAENETNNEEINASQEYAKIKPAPTPVYSLKTTDTKISGQVPANKSTFVIAQTIDIYIAVDYQNIAGLHNQSLYVFAPDGSFYQKFDKQICLTGNCPSGEKPEKIGSTLQYWETLPIAGSYISQYNLIGVWRIDLYLDDVKKTNTTFTLQ